MATMRKDCKKSTKVTLENVQSYHEDHNRSYGDYESYAFAGFKSNKYFTSDRYIPLADGWIRVDGKPLKGFGLEIETECWSMSDHRALATVLQGLVFKVFPEDLFKLQYDSSLGVSGEYDSWGECETAPAIGVECITQIMTKQFIRNHYKDFKAMYDDYFRHLRISCSDTGNCGMHVNVSNAIFGDTLEKQKDSIRKLHYFINKNYELCCRLLNRDEDHTDYCGEMYYGDKEYCKTMELDCGSHGTCMNYSHFKKGRVEIRLVGGQSNYYEFRNTMEVVFFLCDRMRKISWDDLDDLAKVFKGCNQYVVKRLRYSYINGSDYEKIANNAIHEDLELA